MSLEIPTFYCDRVYTYNDRQPFENFGDVLNPFIFSYFNVKLICDMSNPKLFAIGSVLNNNFSENFNGVIWSSGCFNEKQELIKHKAFAVRGKLTLEKLENKENVVLGDGGLIIELLYKPKKNLKKYKLGVMPHYVDIVYTERANCPIYKFPLFNDPEVLFIDIKSPITDIIDQLNNCENVIVSCLHGLVVCDSYKIKHSLFCMHPSKNIMHGGAQNSFKFKDYYSAFDIEFENPDFELSDQMTKENCISYCKEVNKPKMEQIKIDLLSSLYDVINYFKNN